MNLAETGQRLSGPGPGIPPAMSRSAAWQGSKWEENSEDSPRCHDISISKAQNGPRWSGPGQKQRRKKFRRVAPLSISGARARVGLGGKGEKNSEESPRCHETSSVGPAPEWAWAEKGKKIPKSRPAAMKLASFL